MTESKSPPGFKLMPTGLAFSDQLQPYYRKRLDDEILFGFFVQQQHMNLMGICHGGALMTLADISAATNVNSRLTERSMLPTINLSFDFMAPGRAGRWLETRTDHIEVKRRFGFCAGVITDGDTLVVRYSGTFYLPGHTGMVKDNGGDAAISEKLDALSGE